MLKVSLLLSSLLFFGSAAATAATEPESAASAPEPAQEPQPCEAQEPVGDLWLDAFRAGLHRSACRSAHWFDSFFGDERHDSELQRNHGRLRVGVAWDEDDNVDLDVDLKARLYLPRAERRWNAFFGRERQEDFVSGRGSEELETLPDFFRGTEDEEWLAGLGYRPVKRKRSSLDVDAGVRIDFPLDPFVRVRSRRHWFFGDDRLLRVRNTVFWRNQKGYGYTLNTDVERVLSVNLLLRWSTYGTWSESTEGVDWLSGVTLYQNLGGERALAYQASLRGETDLPVNVGRYTVRTIYRQRWLREWFFIEGYAGMTWPRDPDEARRESLQFGVSVEMRYGSRQR